MFAAVSELTYIIPTLYIVFDEDDILLMLFYFTICYSPQSGLALYGVLAGFAKGIRFG